MLSATVSAQALETAASATVKVSTCEKGQSGKVRIYVPVQAQLSSHTWEAEAGGLKVQGPMCQDPVLKKEEKNKMEERKEGRKEER